MDSDSLKDAAEVAAKVVKLSTADWKKMALVLLILLAITCGLTVSLAGTTIKQETTRLDDKNTQQDADISAVKDNVNVINVRLTKVESSQADIAVIKNDVAWMKQYLDRQQAIQDAQALQIGTVHKN